MKIPFANTLTILSIRSGTKYNMARPIEIPIATADTIADQINAESFLKVGPLVTAHTKTTMLVNYNVNLNLNN